MKKNLAILALVLIALAHLIVFAVAAPKYEPRAMMPQPETRLAPFNIRGEMNVQAAMPAMQKLFKDGPTDANLDKFTDMVLHFEEKGGFEGEADMEAARRILGIPESTLNLLNEIRKIIRSEKGPRIKLEIA